VRTDRRASGPSHNSVVLLKYLTASFIYKPHYSNLKSEKSIQLQKDERLTRSVVNMTLHFAVIAGGFHNKSLATTGMAKEDLHLKLYLDNNSIKISRPNIFWGQHSTSGHVSLSLPPRYVH